MPLKKLVPFFFNFQLKPIVGIEQSWWPSILQAQHRKMQKFIVFFSLALCISPISSQAQTNQGSAITPLPFQLFLPKNEADPKRVDAIKNNALLVFLHGSGERG